MCRYAYATTLAIVAESMVGTDERVSFQEPHAQRDAAVQAKIACRGHLPVCQPVEHKTLIKKLCSNRFLCHLMREGYGIPIWSEWGALSQVVIGNGVPGDAQRFHRRSGIGGVEPLVLLPCGI